ncbi:MAG: DUF3108 domain-containing protein [Candidatus Scalindua sp. AMX11]|nr:MAG: DUF3108 domain-containing protein [Candidatus Scalindua sp.]NOG83559.1 DUF3108 domain-containing protein [Planctomycetota bacterium]RZV70937.1 MAG: DUF3108 domain-containing protein [Candidatus Scalindua sp. SCAELEC01]TDE64244.1 MAG: DUF3108 domain-containing protein [Candidatus Scalindua sp. AMX11]GJQ59963.1 MAG: hypothetical protein SCALA701_27640 [Candidatus Scalindua sp.]
MAHTYFVKVAFFLLLFVTFNQGRCLSSDPSDEQISLKSTVPSSPAGEGKVSIGIGKFEDEFLKYNIGFWFFKKMGEVTLQCKRETNTLAITIDGCTTGLVDKIVHRHNVYKTTMVFDEETKRLKPVSSYEKKIKGDEERVKITHYDYGKNIRKFTILRNGVFRREQEVNLDTASNDDGISAFYNLRNESYGRVKDGANFTIKTAHKERISESKISVRSIADSDDLSRWKDRTRDVELMAEITLDPEVIESKQGKLDILLTGDFLPIGFIVRDVIGFGDLYGVLEQKKI